MSYNPVRFGDLAWQSSLFLSFYPTYYENVGFPSEKKPSALFEGGKLPSVLNASNLDRSPMGLLPQPSGDQNQAEDRQNDPEPLRLQKS